MSATEGETYSGPVSFDKALQEFLFNHGKSLDDLKPSVPTSDGASPPVKHIVTKTAHRRRLRLFSGKFPVPSGEFDYESWKRPARQLVDDIGVSQSEKLSRLIESLLPPASKIVWALGKYASADECLDGLEKAFGVTADGDELYLKFCDCYQRSGERASDYLTRLQDLLTRVGDAGAVAEERVNNLRCHQFSRGCLYNETLLLQLDLKKRTHPPDFVTLLMEVRQQEQREWEEEKRAVKSVKCTAAAVATSDEVLELQETVAALRNQLANERGSTTSKPLDSAPQPTRPTGAQAVHWSKPKPRNARQPPICFNCGQAGHLMGSCSNKTDANLVQKQMAARCKKSVIPSSGNDGGCQ
ncbi:paraneoplastic antigen Ma1 homolog [Asterias amurensis]|uniref:paraneoplastic antigen Ma1 homolog n=1 Tax=Asterias amurensis TaxID=7602 RepID=UPI003AB40DF7